MTLIQFVLVKPLLVILWKHTETCEASDLTVRTTLGLRDVRLVNFLRELTQLGAGFVHHVARPFTINDPPFGVENQSASQSFLRRLVIALAKLNLAEFVKRQSRFFSAPWLWYKPKSIDPLTLPT